MVESWLSHGVDLRDNPGGSKFGIFGFSNRGASILDSFRRSVLVLDDATMSNEAEERKNASLVDGYGVSWCQPNTTLMCGAMESMHHSCYKEYSGHLIDLRGNINTMDLRRTNQVPVVRIG